MRTGVLGGELEEVLQAALRVVGQRIDAHDVLLGAGDAHRRAALGERPGAAHGGDDDLLLGRHAARSAAAGARAGARRAGAGGRRATWSCARSSQRLAPDVEHGVGADQRVAQRGGLLGEEVLGLLAVLGGGEVEVAGHAQQLVLADGVAGAAAAVGDVGLDRPEVACGRGRPRSAPRRA